MRLVQAILITVLICGTFTMLLGGLMLIGVELGREECRKASHR